MTKTLKCRHCKNRKPRETMLSVPLGAFCNYSCATSYGKNKAEAARIRHQAKLTRDRKAAFLKSDLRHQKDLTRTACNIMIRLLDQNQPCISCLAPAGTYQMDAGHYKTVGAYPELRFNPLNIHGQCRSCNGTHKRTMSRDRTVIERYTENLAARYGQGLVDYLNGPFPPAKYTCDDLIALRAVFRPEIKRLKQGLPPSRDWRALP